MSRDRKPGVPIWLFIVVVALLLVGAVVAGRVTGDREDTDQTFPVAPGDTSATVA